MIHLTLTNPVVQALIRAMNEKDRRAYLTLFATDAIMTDDGNERGVVEWADHEVFGPAGGTLSSVDREENGGLTLYGTFHSNRWGDIRAVFWITVRDGQITRFDVGQQ